MPVFSRGGWTLQICLISFCIRDKFRKCQVQVVTCAFSLEPSIFTHTLLPPSAAVNCHLSSCGAFFLCSLKSRTGLHCFCSKLYSSQTRTEFPCSSSSLGSCVSEDTLSVTGEFWMKAWGTWTWNNYNAKYVIFSFCLRLTFSFASHLFVCLEVRVGSTQQNFGGIVGFVLVTGGLWVKCEVEAVMWCVVLCM